MPMGFDWVTLLAVLETVTTVLKSVMARDGGTRQKWSTAVAALQEAVIATKTYTAGLERGESQHRKREGELAQLWARAGNRFYGLDGALAERLHLKGDYWTQPEAWTHQQVLDLGIAFDHVANLTSQLLHESK